MENNIAKIESVDTNSPPGEFIDHEFLELMTAKEVVMTYGIHEYNEILDGVNKFVSIL